VNAKNLKPAVLTILKPVTAALIRARIHPNSLTLAGLTVSVASAWGFAHGPLALGATLLLVAGVFDLLDGAVARDGQRMSPYGAFLDSSVDRYAEIVGFLGILWRFEGELWTQLAALIAICGSLMVSYTKARAEGLGQEVSGGLLQRPERIILLALGGFCGTIGLRIALWALAVLTNLTSIQRMLLVAEAMNPPSEAPAGASGVDSRDAEAAPPAV
jgi:CDP-diacylglycerol--glycerol-3-phosphate 3-phosphatidyltransferase